jgi:toxin ParE1/3/4
MSARELRLSATARKDFVGILRDTLKKWGPKQVRIYRDVIAKGLQAVWLDPDIGVPHRDLPKAHKTHAAGSHVIVYRMKGKVVYIVRILHRRMDPTQHF